MLLKCFLSKLSLQRFYFARCVVTVKFDALLDYKRVHSNLNIPYKYIDDNGLKLGEHVQLIRKGIKKNQYSSNVIDRLNEIGFLPHAYKDKHDKIILAFKTFINIYGHGNVVQSFIIGKDDLSFPEVTRGLRLGRILQAARLGAYKKIGKELRELGVGLDFVCTPPNFERYFAALRVYGLLHGNVRVSRTYVVPKNDANYPEECRGLCLGVWLRNIIIAGTFQEYRQRLEDIGVSFEQRSNFYKRDDVMKTIQVYKSLYGHLNVPRSFVVPSDERFPKEMWGAKIGQKIQYWKVWKELKEMGVTNLRKPLPV